MTTNKEILVICWFGAYETFSFIIIMLIFVEIVIIFLSMIILSIEKRTAFIWNDFFFFFYKCLDSFLSILIHPCWLKVFISLKILLIDSTVLYHRPNICVLGSREQLCINQEVMRQESNHIKVCWSVPQCEYVWR